MPVRTTTPALYETFRDCCRPAGMESVAPHDGGREEADPTVSMLVVVPPEEDLPEGTPIFEGSEALGILWTVLERSELRFSKRIVVGHMRPAVGFRHAEIRQQQGDRPAAHRAAAVAWIVRWPGVRRGRERLRVVSP